MLLDLKEFSCYPNQEKLFCFLDIEEFFGLKYAKEWKIPYDRLRLQSVILRWSELAKFIPND
jgi:hypothetical protein